jgi:hypothetical protein
MGEVFLAEGTKLHRRVAIKALPAELADEGGASCFDGKRTLRVESEPSQHLSHLRNR